MVLKGHENHIGAIAWSPDNRKLVTGAGDGVVMLWDATTGQPIRSYNTNLPVTGVDFYNNQESIISISRNQVSVWQIMSFEDGVQWAYDNRFVPEFTCAQRLQYNVTPYCDSPESPTGEPVE